MKKIENARRDLAKGLISEVEFEKLERKYGKRETQEKRQNRRTAKETYEMEDFTNEK